MKKGWKIALISLGSLLGLVVVLIAVVLWLLFTPSQLTAIVNNKIDKFITCEAHFGRVNLTIFKTFPDAGLTINDVYFVNPLDGAASDTVASVGSLTVGIDLKRYLYEDEVIVHQVLLDDMVASLYIDSLGNSNFDIFRHSDKEDDTTKSGFSLDSLPFIDLKRVGISNLDARFVNAGGGMDAEVDDLDLDIKGTLAEGVVDADVKLTSGQLKVESGKLNAELDDMRLSLKAKGNLDQVEGKLKLEAGNGTYNDMINEALQASRNDLLALNVPFVASIGNGDSMAINFLDGSRIKLDRYALNFKGQVWKQDRINMDIDVATDGKWSVWPLLSFVPEQFMGWKKGMDLDGKIGLDAKVTTNAGQGGMPVIDASITLADGLFHYPKAVPYRVSRINGDLAAWIDLSKHSKWRATVKRLTARAEDTKLSISGKADDLLGDMHVDAALKGSLPLADAMPMVPQSLPLAATGDADIDLKADFRLSQIKAKAFDKIKADGMLKFNRLDITYDSMHATAPTLNLALQLPAKVHNGKMADAHLVSGRLKVESGKWNAELDDADISVGVNNVLREQLAAAFEIVCGEAEANINNSSNGSDGGGEVMASLGALELKGTMRMDSTQDNPLRKFNPVADIDMHSAVLYMPNLPDAVRMSQFALQYDQSGCRLKNADVRLGHSDFQLYGTVDNLERWLNHEGMLVTDLNFTSNYTDVDQLMAMFSGMGSDKDTLEQMREEDNVPKEANPFIVPKDVDITLHTHIRRSVAFGNDLNDVAGALTVKDGTAILDQMGFVCKAATMQLTALYRSPRPSHLFTSLDFHLLDIQIDELLDMIPTVDTLVPMLAAFDGNANFHLAAETYLNASYKPLMSSLKGAAAIDGKNLIVMDNNSIAQIAKLMQFKSWKDKDDKIRIDSLDVEMTVLNKIVEVYPFLLNIGKYQLCASGRHSLDNKCGYHIELLKNPLLARVGVDVKGDIAHPQITLGEVKYADYYRPDKQGVVERQTLELKRQIKEALESKVK